MSYRRGDFGWIFGTGSCSGGAAAACVQCDGYATSSSCDDGADLVLVVVLARSCWEWEWVLTDSSSASAKGGGGGGASASPL